MKKFETKQTEKSHFSAVLIPNSCYFNISFTEFRKISDFFLNQIN